MSNAVSSLIFACRNVDKTKKGEIGRAPVALAQGVRVLDEVSRYNKALANGADVATSVFKNLAKESKTFEYAFKGVNWAVKNVNPMICISGALKVAMSDDKTEAAIKEVASLAAMFAGEGLAKAVLPKLIKTGGKTGAMIRGILFVCASIASYSIGEHYGKDLAKDVKSSWSFPPKKIDQMA